MKHDGFILLITDRPAEAGPLLRSVGRALPCRILAPTDALPAERPLLAVFACGSEHAEAAAAQAGRLRAAGVFCLHLLRQASLPARIAPPDSDLDKEIPAATPVETVLACILEAIDRTEGRRALRARRLAMRSEAATGLVADLFTHAGQDGAIGAGAVERGTETVLDAVSEAGISAWLAIVWQHDAGVYQHTLSVAGYAAAFGAEIGLPESSLRRLTRAALLHDIGKARIPAAILNKPGPLTAEQRTLMESHAAIGADLLVAQGGFEPDVVAVVRHHHEKLDGTGYPDGLAGQSVPDLVRMVTICDIYSALTERRIYRAPLRGTEAVTAMSAMRGQLDRALLLAFAPVVARCEVAPGWA
ncbi:HD-GYP domain-containing protein [Methylobacterium sp. A54F]